MFLFMFRYSEAIQCLLQVLSLLIKFYHNWLHLVITVDSLKIQQNLIIWFLSRQTIRNK